MIDDPAPHAAGAAGAPGGEPSGRPAESGRGRGASAPRRPRWTTLALVALLASNLALLALNHRLRRGLAAAAKPHLEAGDVVPPLRALDASGKPAHVGFGGDGRRTLVLVFSPTCGWCDLNMPSWSALLDGAGPRGVRTFAVATRQERSAEYAARHRLARAGVLVEAEPRDAFAWRLVVTPQTILIGPDGRVERNWVGALRDEDLREIERALGIELPPAPPRLREALERSSPSRAGPR